MKYYIIPVSFFQLHPSDKALICPISHIFFHGRNKFKLLLLSEPFTKKKKIPPPEGPGIHPRPPLSCPCDFYKARPS